jgi:hypothetical protein
MSITKAFLAGARLKKPSTFPWTSNSSQGSQIIMAVLKIAYRALFKATHCPTLWSTMTRAAGKHFTTSAKYIFQYFGTFDFICVWLNIEPSSSMRNA